MPSDLTPVAERDSKPEPWRDALKPIPRILSWYKANAVAGILLAAGFVVLKGYALARGDAATALGILQYAGLATVVTAGLLSSLPILAAAMLAYTLSRVLAWVFGKWHGQGPEPPAFSWPLLWVTLGAFVLASVFAPWTYVALAGVIGLVIALMRTLRASGPVARPAAWLVRVLLASAAVVAVISSLYTVWVPHEVVTFRPGTMPPKVLGYVLSEGGGWITILISGRHQIVHYPDAKVMTQTVCENPSGITTTPTLWATVTGLTPITRHFLHPATPTRCPK